MKAETSETLIDSGPVVRLRTPDRGVADSNPARTVGFYWAESSSHACSSPRCINWYPDSAVFIQVCKDKRNVKETAFLKAETRETLKKRHSWKQKQEKR